jgi:hypothetical protein
VPDRPAAGQPEAGFLFTEYCGKMERVEVGEEIDLGRGYDFSADIRSAMNKTSEFIDANKKIISAITNGIMVCGLTGEKK